MGGPGLCDGGGRIGPGQGLAEPQPQLGEQQRPAGVGEDGQAVLERLAGRVLLAAVLGDHAARERGARGQHGQFAVGRNLVQPHHARLGGLGVGQGELSLGEHDEQPRRRMWSSPMFASACRARPATSRCSPRARCSDTSGSVVSM